MGTVKTVTEPGIGVRLPTSRQARVYRLMNPEERHELHDRYFVHRHVGPCPLEAAWSAHDDDRSLLALAVTLGFVLAIAIGFSLLWPHAKVFVPLYNRDETVRSQIILLAAIVLTIPPAKILPRLLRERTENRRLAAAGPDCDPWKGLEDDQRGPLLVSLKTAIPDMLWAIGLRRRRRD